VVAVGRAVAGESGRLALLPEEAGAGLLEAIGPGALDAEAPPDELATGSAVAGASAVALASGAGAAALALAAPG